MAQPALGLDVAKEKIDAFLLQHDRGYHRTCANTPAGFEQLQKWLVKHGTPPVHACLEATGTYGDNLALFLYDHGHTVSIVNPAQIKAYGDSELKRNKTDASDAALLARFCDKQEPRAWTPPPVEVRELQALVRRLESLHEMRQQEANRLASGVRAEVVRRSLEESLAFLEGEITEMERQIREHIDRHPQLKSQRELIDSIPGIGPKTAATLLAEYQDLRAFPSARAMVAFAGLNPRLWESGRTVRGKPRLSKKGSSALRKALYWPAIVAMTRNPTLRQFADRLRGRGKPNLLIIGAVMRKLIHLVFGVLKSGKPFDPDFASTRA